MCSPGSQDLPTQFLVLQVVAHEHSINKPVFSGRDFGDVTILIGVISVYKHTNVEYKALRETVQSKDGHPTLFTIKLYHGGEFTKFPDVQYIDGSVNYVDMVDIDTFSVHELDGIMKGFSYGVPPMIYYHFLVPGGDFHFGLKPLGNDDDL
uniref:PB1-like domain-containing protein n=1 Tax=Lactuca sativa TaxID=4236 RepID=A0A9R1X3E6_LACSA|nr:hypothetical protein LSAT_V11C700369360 [Lactuca sativa]